jgi:hypothetical protein
METTRVMVNGTWYDVDLSISAKMRKIVRKGLKSGKATVASPKFVGAPNHCPHHLKIEE